MRLVRWNEQALSPVGWKWEGLRKGHTKGLFLPRLYIIPRKLFLWWKLSFFFWNCCAAEVFQRLIWLPSLKTKQYNVSCSLWLTYSHPPLFLFKLVLSVVEEKASLDSWTTPIFPVILTLHDCPIRIPYKPDKIDAMNKNLYSQWNWMNHIYYSFIIPDDSQFGKNVVQHL